MNPRELSPDFAQARERLGTATGKLYWRSLEELAQSKSFQELVEREFPHEAESWTNPVSRRRFLKLMGASLALAGLGGCASAPRETILPYVRQPEEITPGRPLFYATAMPLAGYGTGLLVESHMGRPIKVEGNPDHPASIPPLDAPGWPVEDPGTPETPRRIYFGPAHLFAQAAPLTFYDPDRSQTVNHLASISSWEAFGNSVRRLVDEHETPDGSNTLRLAILTETITSPSLAGQLRTLKRRFPNLQWFVHQPTGAENARTGTRFAFGEQDGGVVEPRYHLDNADVILSLDADFLSCGPGHLRYARDFSSRRKVRGEQPMNRLYVVESTATSTGAMADHRWSMKTGQVESFARDLARRLEVPGAPAEGGAGPAHPISENWLNALAADLRRNRGKCLVLAGDGQPPLVHALAHAINQHLGNVGRTVEFLPPIEIRSIPAREDGGPPLQALSLNDLDAAITEGIDGLLILGGNPVYDAPADINFADKITRIPFLVHLGLHEDETSEACHWHLPETHFLEAWGDVRSFDGTVSLIQPLIAPLYQGRSALEVLGMFIGGSERTGHEALRAFWQDEFNHLESPTPSTFDGWWRRALHDGFIHPEGRIAGRDSAARTVTLQANWANAPGVPASAATGLEIVFRPDPSIFDGRFANNGWLQELPKPITKATWDNLVYLRPETAIRLGFAPAGRPEDANGKLVRIDYAGRSVEGPLWVMPGHAADSLTVTLGYGRRRVGRVGNGVGFNAYAIRQSHSPWFDGGVSMTDLGRRQTIATTQHHHLMENRDIVRSGTVSNPPTIPEPFHEPRNTISLYPDHPWNGNQWGMSIDLTLCNGCSACIVACQSENNIPVVGKEQVAAGREMHWLRVDSYYSGTPERDEELETHFMPVMCMHCEYAPCELVCPVVATAHSTDGLNDMVYNRCVGTRYCSNNCPYKVRRFNFLDYTDYTTESRRLGYNPDVTVRTRGVMEKCTYCVQRIRLGQIEARGADRPILDGAIQTACQSACPAGAIVFGDLNANTRVAQLQRGPLNYGLLADLNTRPRTTYLASLKNPNPDIR